MVLIAKKFEVLRGVEPSGRAVIALPRQPVRVATLIDEALFESIGHVLLHNKTVFLEDRFHDWDWIDGKFSYYTRVADKADVLIVYELGAL